MSRHHGPDPPPSKKYVIMAQNPLQAKSISSWPNPLKSTLNTWLLVTWTFLPNPRYLKNLNLSQVLQNAHIFIRNLLAGVIIQRNQQYSDDFCSRCLHEEDLKIWILQMRHYAISSTSPSVNLICRNAAELMVKHMAANLTFHNICSDQVWKKIHRGKL